MKLNYKIIESNLNLTCTNLVPIFAAEKKCFEFKWHVTKHINLLLELSQNKGNYNH